MGFYGFGFLSLESNLCVVTEAEEANTAALPHHIHPTPFLEQLDIHDAALAFDHNGSSG